MSHSKGRGSLPDSPCVESARSLARSFQYESFLGGECGFARAQLSKDPAPPWVRAARMDLGDKELVCPVHSPPLCKTPALSAC